MTSIDEQLITVRALEERALNAWPALHSVLIDGWVFRWSAGYTKRANSANALAPMGAFPRTLEAAEEFYTRQGLPTIFRLSPLAGEAPDVLLARAGYRPLDETIVLVADLTSPSHAEATGPATGADGVVDIAPVPDAVWCDGFSGANNVPAAMRATHDRMLAVLRLPAAFAVLRVGATPVAYGLAVVERGMVGLFDIVTIPTRRRQGYGRQLVGALLGWGQTQGAHGGYLQVVATNGPALALYHQLGFREAYRYHYRVRA